MSVRVVIVGANGLVGARLVQKLVKQTDIHISPTETAPISNIVLFDVKQPTAVPEDAMKDSRIVVELGDLTDKATMQHVLKPQPGDAHVTTIHLAALLSGNSEDDFDLGMKINLFGTINVMECVRELRSQLGGRPQVYVYTSTDYVAAYNQYNREHPVTEESFRLSPVSYGVQKACNELLVCDYSRKGFLDGRVGRLSAVIGRPGFSNSISYPYTGIFTQTLAGHVYEVPLPMDVPYPCSSLNTDVECLIFMCGQMDTSKMTDHNRVVQLPAKSFTLRQLWEAAQEVAKEENIAIGSIKEVAAASGSTTIKEINVCPYVSIDKAIALGMPHSVEAKEIIRDYARTYILKK